MDGRGNSKERVALQGTSDCDQSRGVMGITGRRRGKVKSRNMHKGPMDKDNRVGGRIECGVG